MANSVATKGVLALVLQMDLPARGALGRRQRSTVRAGSGPGHYASVALFLGPGLIGFGSARSRAFFTFNYGQMLGAPWYTASEIRGTYSDGWSFPENFRLYLVRPECVSFPRGKVAGSSQHVGEFGCR